MARPFRFLLGFVVAIVLLRLVIVGAIPNLIIRSGLDKHATLFSMYISVVGPIYVVAVVLTILAFLLKFLRGPRKKQSRKP